MVTIIHPSRQRPKQAYETGLKWIERIGLPESDFEYILSLDSDDPKLWLYPEKMPCLNFTRFIGENRSAIDAINFPAKFYSAYRGQEENSKDFLIVISDDFDCGHGWGVALTMDLRSQVNTTDWILKTRDGIQDWVITLPIMDWVYYRRFNYVYHPDYKHAFCDTEMTCVADMTGRLLTSKLIFIHDHYSIGGAKKDELYERNDKTFNEGRKLFVDRKSRNFDLNPGDIVQSMSNNVYLRMQ